MAIFTEVEKQLLLHLLDRKDQQGLEIAGDTLCKLFIYQDGAAAAHLAARNKFLPRHNCCAALFLFLSERWDEYQSIDFNQGLLSAAYETASPALRKKKRVIEHYQPAPCGFHLPPAPPCMFASYDNPPVLGSLSRYFGGGHLS